MDQGDPRGPETGHSRSGSVRVLPDEKRQLRFSCDRLKNRRVGGAYRGEKPQKKRRAGIIRLLPTVEDGQLAFYYAPGFFQRVREHLKGRLASTGGRPTVSEWRVVRKTRYSERTWKELERLSLNWSRSGTAISPAQVAARIVEEAVGSGLRA